MNRAAQITHALLRIVAGLCFMTHGGQKLFGWFGGMGEGGGGVPLMSQMGLAGVIECFGGALILIGLFVRPVAFIASGEMAVAYFQAHAPHGFFPPLKNHGEAVVLFCFIFLYLSANGAGIWSLDALRRGRGKPPAA